jgi:Cu-processing system permease protein
MFEITKSITRDLVRNWTLWIYVLFLSASSVGLFSIDGEGGKATLGVLNLMLLIVPAFSLIFSVIYYFNSSDFVLLLLAQPLNRNTIITSFIFSLSIVFLIAVIAGCGIPLFLFAPDLTSLFVILAGAFLSVIFVCLALLIGVNTREKSHGLGVALILWFYFALLFDGLILILLYAFNDYPIEKVAVYMTFLNPIDLARIMTLLHTDAAALMGYTGAVFEKFFNARTGTSIGLCILAAWIFFPARAAIRKFNRKSF